MGVKVKTASVSKRLIEIRHDNVIVKIYVGKMTGFLNRFPSARGIEFLFKQTI